MMHALPLAWLSGSLDHLADLSRLSSTALIAAIWQGALLALLAALALHLAPRIPAAARFAIWFAVFSLIAALPFLNRFSSAAAATTSAPAHAFVNLDPRWTLAIAAIWAAASLLRAATLVAAALRVRSLARNATPFELPHTLTASAPRRAQLCSSTDIDRPTVIGFFAPKILIPSWLLDKLTPAELDHIVLHESGHLNRADDWLNLLQKLALVLFPLNPALAWVERRLCFERELACDERVLHILASRRDESTRAATGYASSLTTLAEYRLQRRGLIPNLALTLGALGTAASESELGRRIARILRPATRMRPLHVRLATGAAIAALLFTTTELEHSPQLISFASSSSATQLASADTAANATSAHAELIPGYRAIATRITIPAAMQSRTITDASPRLIASHSRNLAPPVSNSYEPRAIAVNTTVHGARTQHSAAQRPATPHLIAARQSEPQQGEFVITRWTVFQSADGARIVRTSAVFSAAPAPQSMTDPGAQSRLRLGGTEYPTPDSVEHAQVRNPRAQQISQPSSPYAAVPVPGGWLVIQL